MKRTALLQAIILICSIQAFSQEGKPWVLRALNSIGTYIDSMTVRGIDQRYIEVPEKPWQVVLKYNANDMDLTATSKLSAEHMAAKGLYGELNWESAFRPRSASSIGAWVGYRGYGFGYSFSLTRTNGRNFSIGATGSNYGLNLRTRKFSTSELEASMWGYDEDGEHSENDVADTWEPIDVRTTIFDAYYMLNGKRFSYAAAYDQSVQQIRSSGSLMFGIMWYATSLDYSARQNALLIQALGDIGKVKIHEGSIGVGYAYNWVHVKNLLVNVTAMPMLVVHNRSKAYFYESNYDLFLEEGQVSPTGKKAVPDDLTWLEDITLEERATEVRHAPVSFTFDARMSLTYYMNRYYLSVFGQLNHFRNTIDDNKVRLTDWYVNASLGFRF